MFHESVNSLDKSAWYRNMWNQEFELYPLPPCIQDYSPTVLVFYNFFAFSQTFGKYTPVLKSVWGEGYMELREVYNITPYLAVYY